MKNNLLSVIKIIRSLQVSKASIFIFLFFILAGITLHTVLATTPNPGHPWSEVGDGTFQVTGPTAMHVYTVVNSNATLLTDAAIVTVPQGGLGISSYTQGDMVYGNGVNTYGKLAKDSNATRYISNTGASNSPAWAQLNLTNGISGTLPVANGGMNNVFTQLAGPTSLHTYTLPDATSTILTSNDIVTLAQGGTSKSLTASNGGILYTDTDSVEVLAGAATAGQILQSGASSAPTWSTATYPSTAGSAGNVLTSDGANFVSNTPSTITTATNKPYTAIGTAVATTINSLTSARVGRFNLNSTLTLGQITYNVPSQTTPGTIRICIYDETGTTKLIDVTDTPAITPTVNPVTVSPAVTLPPGNYYVAIMCATTCSNGVTSWSSNAVPNSNGATIPSGKRAVEGTVTMTSGVCNSSLGAITAGTNQMPMLRLDA